MDNFDEVKLKELAATCKELTALLNEMAVKKETGCNTQYNNAAMQEANGTLVDIVSRMLSNKALDPEMRIAMVLKYVCGKSDKKIKAETGYSLKNVSKNASPASYDVPSDSEEKYQECLKELHGMLSTYKDKKYIVSKEFKKFCKQKGVSDYKFRQWLYANNYVEGKRINSGITTSFNTYLGGERRERCTVFL